jgi:nickel-dependent lactate racemase
MDETGKQQATVRSGNIKDNPIHQDMLEFGLKVSPSFIFNVIMGHDGKIARAVCGDL